MITMLSRRRSISGVIAFGLAGTLALAAVAFVQARHSPVRHTNSNEVMLRTAPNLATDLGITFTQPASGTASGISEEQAVQALQKSPFKGSTLRESALGVWHGRGSAADGHLVWALSIMPSQGLWAAQPSDDPSFTSGYAIELIDANTGEDYGEVSRLTKGTAN